MGQGLQQHGKFGMQYCNSLQIFQSIHKTDKIATSTSCSSKGNKLLRIGFYKARKFSEHLELHK